VVFWAYRKEVEKGSIDRRQSDSPDEEAESGEQRKIVLFFVAS
jgi:hypothetical protein